MDRPSGLRGALGPGTVVFPIVVLGTMLGAAYFGHGRHPGPVVLTFSVVTWLPLLGRRSRPLAVLLAVVALEALDLALMPLLDPSAVTAVTDPTAAYQPVPVATAAAVFSYAARRSQPFGWAAGGGAALTLLAVAWASRSHSLAGTDFIMVDLVLIGAMVGVAVSTRRERTVRRQRESEDDARRQVVAERLRIARDLHDVLAHHLTLVNAQAGVADYLLRTDPDAAATALRDISQNTRRALDELRATVGLLRYDGGSDAENPGGSRHPAPGLDSLEELVAEFRSAGTAVTFEREGASFAVSANTDLAAYRIVQEAVTNATKHALGASVHVTVIGTFDDLDITVENGPTGKQRHRGPGTGHGLIGMRERAAACGGTLSAERTPQGGFRVHAVLPTPAEDHPGPRPVDAQ